MSGADANATGAATPAQVVEGGLVPAEAPEGQVASFPPFPPYAAPGPPSVADAVIAGHGLRRTHKAVPKKSVRPLPRPAKPRYPKATDVKMSRQAMRAHARCLRRHGAVLTDRLEYMSKPRRRNIIWFWRENADTLPADTIARLRAMLDADEPFKPDQAYAYFVNLKKTKKRQAALERARVRALKADINSMCSGKKFMWARNAAVAFARGVQQRLSKPGRYVLTDGMLRLSDIILSDICGFMKMRKIPSREFPGNKASLMMEVSDKVAVWIDEILSESDDRMLMMDFDEDDGEFEDIPNVLLAARGGGLYGDGDGGDGGGAGGGGMDSVAPGTGVRGKRGEDPAYLKFRGNMKKAFELLTDEMKKKGDANLISYGKFEQSYDDARHELKHTPDLTAKDFSAKEAENISKKLTDLTEYITPQEIAPAMKDIIEICSNYLAQNAEYNKEKGPLFKLLIKQMKKQPNARMYEKGKIKRNNAEAAKELEDAKGLESNHDDPSLTESIFANMKRLVSASTPHAQKKDMDDTLTHCSKYLSQKAVDDTERGPAFDFLIKQLEIYGDRPFSDYPLATNHTVAYALSSAPGLGTAVPDPKTKPELSDKLHSAIDTYTPKELKEDMNNVIDLCSNYLSAYMRDRGPALEALLKMMRENPKEVFAERKGYPLDYDTGAKEVENSPAIVPYLPIKDISDEGKEKLTKRMEHVTPPELKYTMTALINDVAKHLSQIVGIRSGAAGERYKMSFLAAVKKSLGSRPLFNYKSYGKTYADAADDLHHVETAKLKDLPKETVHFSNEINSEMKRGIPTKLAPTVLEDMTPTVTDASLHLAKTGVEKGEAMEYVVGLMREKGQEKLANLQGYDQTYDDGARRLENTQSLRNDTIDLGAYSTVKTKLTEMTKEKPDETFVEVLPNIIDDSANFLSAPVPETNAEKKQVLADLMGREGDKIIGQKDDYKLTFTGGGDDVKKSPVGVTTARDEEKKKEMVEQLNTVIPDKKMGMILKETTHEGGAYLADVVEGRGQALDVLGKSLKDEGRKEFINVGKFKKNHEQTGDMVTSAPFFKSQNPSPVIMEHIEHRLDVLEKTTPEDQPLAKAHMKSMTEIAAKYVGTKATQECGLNASELAELDAQGFNDEAKAAAEARRLAAIAATLGETMDGPPGETREQRLMRLEAEQLAKEEEERRKRLEQERLEAERLRLLEEQERRNREEAEKYKGAALGADYGPEHIAALDILHAQLNERGPEIFYEQPHTTLTHAGASQWLSESNPMNVDNSVKESPDTIRLQKKFEKKLSALVKDKTPPELNDAMQDIVIEGSQKTAEYFVTSNYKAVVNDSLIAEMQKRGNEVLVSVDGAPETQFFAAQRVKRKDLTPVQEPNYPVSNEIAKKLDEVVRNRPMARKVSKVMKEHVKDTSKFLSPIVTKPDEYIETYVALLDELDLAGDITLIEGDHPRTCKESANYLRQLTTFKDTIGLPNNALKNDIQQKLQAMMYHAPRSVKKASPAVLDNVIADVAGLLVSSVMLQAEKTEALKYLVREMDASGDGALLRHGVLRKSFKEGADELKGKTTGQLDVPNADPVVSRKVLIKLTNLMQDRTPRKFQKVMPGVIEDATKYLAVRLIEPRVIKVCKCYKNVFVQCELWCDEVLRRIARPCCTCSRHVSVQALQDLVPAEFLKVNEDQSIVFAPGVKISLKPCPNQATTRGPNAKPYCPAHHPATTSYLLHSTTHKKFAYCDPMQPSPSTTRFDLDSMRPTPSTSGFHLSPSSHFLPNQTSSFKSLMLEIHDDQAHFIRRQQEELQSFEATENQLLEEISLPSYSSASSSYNYRAPPTKPKTSREQFSKPMSDSSSISQCKSEYSSRTPIITSEQNAIDWDSTMVSLLWNLMAWRDWIQEIVDHALAYQYSPSYSRGDTAISWVSFYRRVTTEALQWRQYNVFSRQLTTNLHLRYRDKEISSPERSNVKTKTYLECQEAMLDIIDMFNRWTEWLTLVVKETDSLQLIPGSEIPLYVMRWNHLKTQVEGNSKDWANYLKFLKVSWERKYRAVIADYLPSLEKPGPVWVVSACGAVPSGAVAAGLYNNEVIWVARALHRCTMLPATLLPSKHCCLVYADGQVHSYTKYQVMCNAEVRWVAWRCGSVHESAVSVAPGTYLGRVHYHGNHLLGTVREPNCHCCVVIFGRPFAFNCYELLLASDGGQ